MFNSHEPTQKVNVNAVTGILSKTCKKSFFKACKVDSSDFEILMGDEPCIPLDENCRSCLVKVIILQAMLMGEGRVMFEIIKKSDYKEFKRVREE